MNLVLIAITLGSLLLAFAACAVAWRASQDQKLRAAARVAGLASAAGVVVSADPPSPVPSAAAAAAPGAPAALAFGNGPQPGRAASTRRELDAFATEQHARDVVLPTEFLGSRGLVGESSWRQRGLVAGAAVLAVLLSAFVVSRIGAGEPESRQAAATPAALELLSLGHQREGANLSVTGLVRNPASAGSVARVSAVVLLFDGQGTLVTSAKAPLDYVTLSAGAESPFVVRVQAPPSVARYRVSFQADGGTLPHVDRRGDGAPSESVAATRQ